MGDERGDMGEGEVMEEMRARFREMRSELRQLQRQVARLTQATRTQTGTMMSLDEAAFYTGYAKNYLYRLTATGQIPCHRPTKRRVFIERDELDKWLRGAQGEG